MPAKREKLKILKIKAKAPLSVNIGDTYRYLESFALQDVLVAQTAPPRHRAGPLPHSGQKQSLGPWKSELLVCVIHRKK